ncbi:MAG: LPS-assembly protein LptD, partial [Aromatoleum sp.]|nr:LPS-assembly protein LptD [Aromatoleum sp.]
PIAAAQTLPPAPGPATSLPEPVLRSTPQLEPPLPRKQSAPPPGQTAPRPSLQFAPIDLDGGSVFVRANRIDGIAEKYVEAEGKVELRTRRETVLADWLRYDFETQEVWGKGDVLLRRGTDSITGPEARFKRDTETGYFKSPRYFIGENGARGSASELRFAGPDRYEVTDARYTTCAAPREDWYVRMDELAVDNARLVGTGRNATLYFLGAPVAYSPWLEFPLSNQRKSGFLTATLGSTGSRGLEVAAPYYFNLAPNYDATLTPRLMTKRGLQMDAQGRYLTDSSQGEANAEYLHNDRVTGTNRYLLSWKHNQNLDFVPGLAGYWNLNKVSDDTYFSDLSDRVAVTSQSTLPREGGFAYTRGPLTMLAREQSFQTLQDPNAPVLPPYNRLPQVLATIQEVDWNGVGVGATGEYVRFRQSALPQGDRFYAYPTATWSRQGAAWFFTAQGGVHARHYALEDAGGNGDSFDYAIPIASVDAGLVFERDWSAFGQNLVQTLEPRAYYVYIPYRDQSRAPAFDTALDDFNFGQLFVANRYLGNDRIGDANQVTLALTSRFLDPATGAERLRVAIGDRFYFNDQRVTLNEAPRSGKSSDVLLLAEGRLSDAWYLAGATQYNFDAGQLERFTAGLRYTPAPGKVINASYRYTRNLLDQSGTTSELRQFDLSAQWPLDANWSLMGRWNYSVVDRKMLEGVAGVEYNAGCWALRLVGQRLTTTTQTTTTSVYLQIELTGLARFGTSPLDLLRRSVPGYLKSTDPTVTPRESGDYFQEY